MEDSRKILYVVDYLPDIPNSVGNILNAVLNNVSALKVKQIIVQRPELYFSSIQKRYVNGFLAYTGENITKFDKLKSKVMKRIKKTDNSQQTEIDYFQSLIDIEKPDFIIFLIFNPEKHLAKICKDNGIKNYWMLYDTFVSRPGLDITDAVSIEETAMKESLGYYVPSFFYDDYRKYYCCDKLKSYNLPLLIPKNDVVDAFNKHEDAYEYTYFGQVQSFRNADKIKELCRKIHVKIDVFTTDDLESDDVFVVHKALSGEQLYQVAAHSKYLIVFDNGKPYENYLPSKVFLYVSFTKPVIAFGDNKDSALLRFFKSYPCFFYQDFNESFSGLVDFLNENVSSSFDQNIYDSYNQYLPETALDQFVGNLKEELKGN